MKLIAKEIEIDSTGVTVETGQLRVSLLFCGIQRAVHLTVNQLILR